LLQARRLDGGDQLFARAFDFGYSKTREEAAGKWDEEILLGDMVRAIRMYRPLVLISGFSGTPADRHGHHQYAGYLTPIAFHIAGDPSRYPQQLADGLRPWEPFKLYVRQRIRPGEEDQKVLRVSTGILDPALGRTYFEVAMEGRSQHKSQGMGTLELRGSRSSGLRLVETHESAPIPETHVFDGIDTSLGSLGSIAGIPSGVIDQAMGQAQRAAERALAEYHPLAPDKLVPTLVEGLQAIRQARELVKSSSLTDLDAQYSAEFLLDRKENEFSEALRMAAGVVVDALSEDETLVAGETTRVDVRVFFPESSPAKVSRVELSAPEGWQIVPSSPTPPTRPRGAWFRVEKGREEAFFDVTAGADTPVTQPYWLASPRKGDTFAWSEDDPKGSPFQPPVMRALVSMEIGGASIDLAKSVEYRYSDPARGELRRDLNVVPALSLSLDSNLLIIPTSTSSHIKRLAVRVENNARRATAGTVTLELPSGWKSEPMEASFDLERKGEGTALVFDVKIPGNTQPGTYSVVARAMSGGVVFDREMHTIAYPHIQTHRFYSPAAAVVQVLDLSVENVRIGYIMGSGDRVPDAIRRLGLGVTFLDAEDLATGDLSVFDTIVVGIRASRVRPDFVANNGRILDFVRRGGTLIVQYQRQDYVNRNLTPYPAGMSASENYSSYRITDETAAVKVLQPAHPLFNFPNRITDEDWEGWVQERSSYHLTDLDSRYIPLLEAADPNEAPHQGGLVYAEVGNGRFVYSGYSFFRQLPAGVPGAYRLFANLLSLSKAPRTE
jgi:hypothetical protein